MATARGALPGVRHLSLPAEAPGEAGEGKGGSHCQTLARMTQLEKSHSLEKRHQVLQWGRPQGRPLTWTWVRTLTMNTGRLNTTGSDLRGRVLGKEKRKGLHRVLIREGVWPSALTAPRSRRTALGARSRRCRPRSKPRAEDPPSPGADVGPGVLPPAGWSEHSPGDGAQLGAEGERGSSPESRS